MGKLFTLTTPVACTWLCVIKQVLLTNTISQLLIVHTLVYYKTVMHSFIDNTYIFCYVLLHKLYLVAYQ